MGENGQLARAWQRHLAEQWPLKPDATELYEPGIPRHRARRVGSRPAETLLEGTAVRWTPEVLV